jgi:hypothetical protein
VGGKADDVRISDKFHENEWGRDPANLKEILKGELQLKRSVIGN